MWEPEVICRNLLCFCCFCHIAWPQHMHKCWAYKLTGKFQNPHCFVDFHRQINVKKWQYLKIPSVEFDKKKKLAKFFSLYHTSIIENLKLHEREFLWHNQISHDAVYVKNFKEIIWLSCFEKMRTTYGSWQTASQQASESCESSQRVMRVMSESCESSCEPCETDSQSIFLSSAFGGFWLFGTSFRYLRSPFNIVLLSAFIFFIFC